MIYPQVKQDVKHHKTQEMQMRGINLTDNYADGQMESCRGISTDRYPYITTAQELQLVDAGVPEGYHAVSMFAWEKLFVVTDEPSDKDGFKCYYGGVYCGDVNNLTIPKQYAVVNSKLIVWPDKVMFEIMAEHPIGYSMDTAPILKTVDTGTAEYRKAVS